MMIIIFVIVLVILVDEFVGADPWRQVLNGQLLDETGAVMLAVPHLEQEDQPREYAASRAQCHPEFRAELLPWYR